MADSKVQPELVELSDDFPFTGDVSGTVADGSITDVKVSDMAASKLTGALPALSGAALTNLPASYTKSANDPATNTNPSAVGALWVNQVSGETYVCTDATTDANVWYNVGGGSGDVHSYTGFQGTTYGYAFHGGPAPATGSVESYSYTSDTGGTHIGNMTQARRNYGACTSTTHGYFLAGDTTKTIDRFNFVGTFVSADVGDLRYAKNVSIGSSSELNGYSHADGPNMSTIDKISFASATTDGVPHGDLSLGRNNAATAQDLSYSFMAGGHPYSNVIDKFAHSSNVTGTQVGTLRVAVNQNLGCCDTTYGYSLSAYTALTSPGVYATNDIDRYSFAQSSGQAVGHGELNTAQSYGGSTSSSTTHGYLAGGNKVWSASREITKMSFASNVTMTRTGDLAKIGGLDYAGQGCNF